MHNENDGSTSIIFICDNAPVLTAVNNNEAIKWKQNEKPATWQQRWRNIH